MLDKVIRLSAEQIYLKWDACWSFDRIEKAIDGRESITLDELFDEPFPPDTLLWLMLRPEIIHEKHLHELACRYAEYAIEQSRSQYGALLLASVEDMRRWVRGELDIIDTQRIDTELRERFHTLSCLSDSLVVLTIRQLFWGLPSNNSFEVAYSAASAAAMKHSVAMSEREAWRDLLRLTRSYLMTAPCGTNGG